MAGFTAPQVDHNLYKTIVPQDYTQQIIQSAQYKQQLYDVGLEQVRSKVSSMNDLSSNVLSEPVKGMVNKYNKDVNAQLKKVSNADFSIQGNVDNVDGVYDNLINNNVFMADYSAAQNKKNILNTAIRFRDSDKKELYDRYSDINLQASLIPFDDLQSATTYDEVLKGAAKTNGARYTPYIDVSASVLAKLEAAKLKVTQDFTQGGYKISKANGEMAYSSFSNFIKATASAAELNQLKIEGDVEFYNNYKNDPSFIDKTIETVISGNKKSQTLYSVEIEKVSKNLSVLQNKDKGRLTDKDKEDIESYSSNLNRLQSDLKQINDNMEDFNSLDRSNEGRMYNVLNNLYNNVHTERYISTLATSYADSTEDKGSLSKDDTYFAKLAHSVAVTNANTSRLNAEINKENSITNRLEYDRKVIKDRYDMGLIDKESDFDPKELSPFATGAEASKIDVDGVETFNILTNAASQDAVDNALGEAIGNVLGVNYGEVIGLKDAIEKNNINLIEDNKFREKVIKMLGVDIMGVPNKLSELPSMLSKNPYDFKIDGITIPQVTAAALKLKIGMEGSIAEKTRMVKLANKHYIKNVNNLYISEQEKTRLLQETPFSIDENDVLVAQELSYSYPKIVVSNDGIREKTLGISNIDTDKILTDAFKSDPNSFYTVNKNKSITNKDLQDLFKTGDNAELLPTWWFGRNFKTIGSKGEWVSSGEFFQDFKGTNNKEWLTNSKDITAELAEILITNSSDGNRKTYEKGKKGKIDQYIQAYQKGNEFGFSVTNQAIAKQVIATSMGLEKWDEVPDGYRNEFKNQFGLEGNYFTMTLGAETASYSSEDYFLNKTRTGVYGLQYGGGKDSVEYSQSPSGDNFRMAMPKIKENTQMFNVAIDRPIYTIGVLNSVPYIKGIGGNELIINIPKSKYSYESMLLAPSVSINAITKLETDDGRKLLIKMLKDNGEDKKYSGIELEKILKTNNIL